MITPLQQTPLPIDPIRQQITPTTPVMAPPPPPLADQPLKAAANPQDKFNPKSQEDGGNRQQQQLSEQQRSEARSKLRNAFLRLNELQAQANAAVSDGNAAYAKELAAAATEVARTIPASVGILQLAAEQAGALMRDPTGGGDGATAFDMARASLGAAKSIIETAASIPYHPIPDRIAIDNMRHEVLDAMADVEAIASKAASAVRSVAQGGATQHIDVKV